MLEGDALTHGNLLKGGQVCVPESQFDFRLRGEGIKHVELSGSEVVPQKIINSLLTCIDFMSERYEFWYFLRLALKCS